MTVWEHLGSAIRGPISRESTRCGRSFVLGRGKCRALQGPKQRLEKGVTVFGTIALQSIVFSLRSCSETLEGVIVWNARSTVVGEILAHLWTDYRPGY